MSILEKWEHISKLGMEVRRDERAELENNGLSEWVITYHDHYNPALLSAFKRGSDNDKAADFEILDGILKIIKSGEYESEIDILKAKLEKIIF